MSNATKLSSMSSKGAKMPRSLYTCPSAQDPRLCQDNQVLSTTAKFLITYCNQGVGIDARTGTLSVMQICATAAIWHV